MEKLSSIGAAFCAVAGLSLPAEAHHSFARYDFDKEMVVQGTVKEFQFTNPHCWIHVAVTENGKTQTWSLEGGSTSALLKAGWKRNTVKPGDTITISFHPTREASTEGSMMVLKDINGVPFAGITPRGGTDDPVTR